MSCSRHTCDAVVMTTQWADSTHCRLPKTVSASGWLLFARGLCVLLSWKILFLSSSCGCHDNAMGRLNSLSHSQNGVSFWLLVVCSRIVCVTRLKESPFKLKSTILVQPYTKEPQKSSWNTPVHFNYVQTFSKDPHKSIWNTSVHPDHVQPYAKASPKLIWNTTVHSNHA